MDALLLHSLQGYHTQGHGRSASEPSQRTYGTSVPELSGLRERVWYLVSRAYQNLYGQSMPADEEYRHTLCHAALQLMQDERAIGMTDKALLQAFEDIIRISDEHTREARRHLSRASNPVYLREMALDKALEKKKYLAAIDELMPQNEVRTIRAEHTGTLYRHAGMVASDVTTIACQQLSITLEKQ